MSYRARQIIVVKQDASRKSRRERMKAMSGSNLAMASGGNLEKLAHSRQESLSDFGLASAGSLYGGSMDDLTSLNGSETESSLGPGTPGVPGDRTKRRSVGTLFLDNTNTLARFNSYANLAEEIGMIRGHEEAEHEDDGPSWQTLFEAPSETEKFAAIEALFAAAGIDLPATQGAGPHVFDADPAVTFVRLDGGRNLVLFAPSLGHAVSALPRPTPRSRRSLRLSSTIRGCTAGRTGTFATRRRRSSADNTSQGRSRSPLRASRSPSSPSASARSTSPLRATLPTGRSCRLRRHRHTCLLLTHLLAARA